jgi:hypothetical protein
MKSLLVCALLIVGGILAEEGESYEGESLDCKDLEGTYSTILQVSPYTFASLFESSDESGEPAGFQDDYEQFWMSPDIVARFAIYENCRVAVNLNTLRDLFGGNQAFPTLEGLLRVNKAGKRNSYLCGRIQIKTGPNFIIDTPVSDPDEYLNYFRGSSCTVEDEETIHCSILFRSLGSPLDDDYDPNAAFTATLVKRNDDVDDDIDEDIENYSGFWNSCWDLYGTYN